MGSLWDFMRMNGLMGGCDCYDDFFDVPGTCMEPIEDEENDYDRVNNWILKNTEKTWADPLHPQYDTMGNFTDLVKKFYPQFVEFSQRNREYFIMSNERTDEELFKGVCTVFTLMGGGYGDEDYADFVRIFGVSA